MEKSNNYTQLTILEFPRFMNIAEKKWVDKIRYLFENNFLSAELNTKQTHTNEVDESVMDNDTLKISFNGSVYEYIDNYIESWGVVYALTPGFDKLRVLFRNPELGEDTESLYMKILYTIHNVDGEIVFAAIVSEMIPEFNDDEYDVFESNLEYSVTFKCNIDQSDEVKEQAKEILNK